MVHWRPQMGQSYILYTSAPRATPLHPIVLHPLTGPCRFIVPKKTKNNDTDCDYNYRRHHWTPFRFGVRFKQLTIGYRYLALRATLLAQSCFITGLLPRV